MNRHPILMLLVLLMGIAQPSLAAPVQVARVLDGDTLEVVDDGRLLKVRIFGIDAPERTQPGGDAAREALQRLLIRAKVDILPVDVDRYGRTVARLRASGRDVAEALVRSGHAWQFQRYDDSLLLREAEALARQGNVGLWREPDPVPPWEWRDSARPAATDMTSADCRPAPRCSQMTSCQQARAALARCGSGRIDGDGDGNPCEKLCTPTG